MIIREGTEEVGSKKSCINVDHIAQDRRGPPLVDADWHAFCQAIYKGIEGEYWEELYEHHKEMSKAAGFMKPNENRKRTLTTQNARTTFWGETKHDWNCGKSTSKNRTWHWTKR